MIKYNDEIHKKILEEIKQSQIIKHTVTGLLRELKQPFGGYIPSSLFVVDKTNENFINPINENIYGPFIGMTVDYLSRFLYTQEYKRDIKLDDITKPEIQSSFQTCFIGAYLFEYSEHCNPNKKKICEDLYLNHYKKINGLDNQSIISAIQIVKFEPLYRAGIAPDKEDEYYIPDEHTINNIRKILENILSWLKKFPPIHSGVYFDNKVFEESKTICAADGDYMSEDTLWEIKCYKSKYTNKNQRLQLLMYYILAVKSKLKGIEKVKYIGIFNPRWNIIYRCPIDSINKETAIKILKIMGF